MGTEELLKKEVCKLIKKKLACYETMWGGEPRHDVPKRLCAKWFEIA